MVPRHRKPKKVMRTVVNKPKNELLPAERAELADVVPGLAAGAEASAIAPPAGAGVGAGAGRGRGRG